MCLRVFRPDITAKKKKNQWKKQTLGHSQDKLLKVLLLLLFVCCLSIPDMRKWKEHSKLKRQIKYFMGLYKREAGKN